MILNRTTSSATIGRLVALSVFGMACSLPCQDTRNRRLNAVLAHLRITRVGRSCDRETRAVSNAVRSAVSRSSGSDGHRERSCGCWRVRVSEVLQIAYRDAGPSLRREIARLQDRAYGPAEADPD